MKARCVPVAAATLLFWQSSQALSEHSAGNFDPLVLPLTFEVNRGQAAKAVRYLARSPDFTVFLTGDDAVIVGAADDTLRLHLVGANPTARIEGIQQLPGISNYFVGNDPAHWQRGIANYAKVRYAHAYPGIDVIYYGNRQHLEYDFEVAPHADPGRIAMDFSGAKPLSINADGDLVRAGKAILRRPVAYQEFAGSRRAVEARYVVRSADRVVFALGRYDKSKALVIDPLFVYSSYLGGGADDGGVKIAVDNSGAAYVTGHTNSVNFPTTAGSAQTLYAGGGDAFVSKFNAAGTALIYSTYLGGTGADAGQAIAVDTIGNAYVVGNTNSNDFPVTATAAQAALGGGNDAFLSLLDGTGALVYSTYLGGSGLDVATGVAVDAVGSAYVTGYTQSVDFPTTVASFQPGLGGGSDAFVTKFLAAGSIVYCTYLGGSTLDIARGIDVDTAGNAYIVGYTQSADFPTTVGALQTTYGGGNADAFVAQLNPLGSALNYATFLGGSGDDYATSVRVDGNGQTYIVGNTNSTDFPVTGGAVQPNNAGGVDAFVAALDAAGAALIYSTYMGGSGYDTALGVAIDGDRAAYVTGYTQSTNFPITSNAYQPNSAGGTSDAFIAQVTEVGARGYASYLGGSGLDAGYGIAVSDVGTVYVTGNTTSSDFPTTAGALQSASGGGGDAFITAIPATAFDEIFRNGFE
jgi:hypothetical protein